MADGKLKYASEESKARKLRPSATAAQTHSLPGKIRRHGLEDPSLTRTLHSGGGLGDDAGNAAVDRGPDLDVQVGDCCEGARAIQRSSGFRLYDQAVGEAVSLPGGGER